MAATSAIFGEAVFGSTTFGVILKAPGYLPQHVEEGGVPLDNEWKEIEPVESVWTEL